jgi:hypothetical protein
MEGSDCSNDSVSVHVSTFRVTEKRRQHFEQHKIDAFIEANAEKQRSTMISFNLKHKYHKELLFLNPLGFWKFSAESYCFMKQINYLVEENEIPNKLLSRIGNEKCFRDNIWNRKFTLFIVLLGKISIQARTID